MVEIKNVAIVGANGQLGGSILSALVTTKKFNVTIISRNESSSTFPSDIAVTHADYTSVSSLTTAFKGQDAVISVVGVAGLAGQSILFDAAVAAGVKRFLPSEFGSDIANANVAALPCFGPKLNTRKHIEAKIAAGADITYTYVVNGAFLDWGLKVGFLFAWKDGKPTIYNSGNNEFSTTTLESIGLATVGVLSHYEETKNRSVYVESIRITMNKMLELAQKAMPEKTFTPIQVDLADVKKASDEGFAKGDFSGALGYVYCSIFGGQTYDMPFSKIDNELLGVPCKTEADVESIFRSLNA